MPIIKARTRGKQIVRDIVRLDRHSHETLHAYAVFLGEPTDYVLTQLIDTVLERDKEFLAWRAIHGAGAGGQASRRSTQARGRRTGPALPIDHQGRSLMDTGDASAAATA